LQLCIVLGKIIGMVRGNFESSTILNGREGEIWLKLTEFLLFFMGKIGFCPAAEWGQP
jgi:hypothetical protein